MFCFSHRFWLINDISNSGKRPLEIDNQDQIIPSKLFSFGQENLSILYFSKILNMFCTFKVHLHNQVNFIRKWLKPHWKFLTLFLFSISHTD